MAEPATREQVNALDELDDDEFLTLVQNNIDTHTGDKQLWVALCHADLVDRTVGCLDEIAEALQRYVTAKGVGPNHHKAKLLNHTRARLRQANAHAGRANAHQAYEQTDIGALKALLRALTFAVDAHRRACIELDLAPEQHDLALWGALEELRLPAGDNRLAEGPSLAEQIVSGRWANREAVTSRG